MNAQTLNSSARRPHPKVSSTTPRPSLAAARGRLPAAGRQSEDVGLRVDVSAVLHDLEVQVATGRGSGRARVRDDLSLLDLLPVVDLELRVVVVRRRDRTAVDLAVGDDDPVAVAAGPRSEERRVGDG